MEIETIIGWIAGAIAFIGALWKIWSGSNDPGGMLFQLLFKGKSRLVKVALAADGARIARKFATVFRYDLVDQDLDELRTLETYMDEAISRLRQKHPEVEKLG
jgi:hypothetical protein